MDSHGNKIVTDSPQDGMTECVLKDSYDDPSPSQRSQKKNKSYKGRQKYQKESVEAEAEKDTAEEAKEAALTREGNKCYTQALNVVSGGSVSDVYYWRICKDKNGKTVYQRRL